MNEHVVLESNRREIDEQQSINNTNGIDGNITGNMNRQDQEVS